MDRACHLYGGRSAGAAMIRRHRVAVDRLGYVVAWEGWPGDEWAECPCVIKQDGTFGSHHVTSKVYADHRHRLLGRRVLEIVQFTDDGYRLQAVFYAAAG